MGDLVAVRKAAQTSAMTNEHEGTFWRQGSQEVLPLINKEILHVPCLGDSLSP